ncbi:hypothetical protein J2Z44_002974 [Clostridium punense]|uniref:DNA primase n=1 Tax=Clostridium punense TaxID=1054297 RepID=A0ABS4K5T8_9CLOT|nr:MULTISPECIES: hypothetical protein [Clostridium]EQB86557.1 hypothetical protein M918_13780 [Clostridium sp. BL8]MBP2023139.1 hypothetical protein [Clostridium punense]
MQAKDFLELLHGKNLINFRLINSDNAFNTTGLYDEETIKKLKKYNEQGYNVYFVVNGGGTQKHQINKFNAVFIDLDCGRNDDKNYYPLEETKQYKEKCIDKLKEFKNKPSITIETRNGLHVYWLLNEGASNEEFEDCQLRLINYFQSDKQVKTVERIMRVPDYYWTKDINNRFMCKVLELNNIRYDIEDIICDLPYEEKIGQAHPTNKYNNNTNVFISGTSMYSHNLDLVRNSEWKSLREIIKPKQVMLSNYKDVYDYLKKQDLKNFLGLPKSFNCIFHEDKNPSANIFLDPKTNYYWYKCYSEDCDVVKDIISITENILMCNTPQALNFLRRVYDIKFVESDWEKEMKEILDSNIRFLMDSERFKIIAPETYKRIKNYIPNLILINSFAKEKVFTDNFTDGSGIPLFFASLSHLQSVCKRYDQKRMTSMITLLTYLGLLNKVKENEIPDFLLKESKYQAKIKGQKNIINYYSIPSYCDAIMAFSESKAKEFNEKGLTMKGISRELIYRTFGEEEANRVFPQSAGKQLTDMSEEFSLLVDRVILNFIKIQGYVREGQVIESFKGNKEILRCRIKRVIPETLEKYDLVRIKLNKLLKERLNIDEVGYPYVIMQRDKYNLYSQKYCNNLFNFLKSKTGHQVGLRSFPRIFRRESISIK